MNKTIGIHEKSQHIPSFKKLINTVNITKSKKSYSDYLLDTALLFFPNFFDYVFFNHLFI